MLLPEGQRTPTGQVFRKGHLRGQGRGFDGQVAAKLQVFPAEPGFTPLRGQQAALGAAIAALKFIGQTVKEAVQTGLAIKFRGSRLARCAGALRLRRSGR